MSTQIIVAPLGVDSPDNTLLPSPSAPLDVVKVFLGARYMHGDSLTLRYWRGDWRSWSGNKWEALDRDNIRAQLYEFTDGATYAKQDSGGETKFMPWLPNARRINDLLDALKVPCATPASVNPSSWLDGRAAETIIACRNGLLKLPSRTLLPHSPLFFNVQVLPFDYDGTAECPVWEKFMCDLWGSDDEPPNALEEMLGCAVAGKLDLHRILVLVGPPRAGKSLIASIFEAVVGKANTSWASLVGLADDKTLSSLIGKSLCINGDIRATGRRGPEIAEALLRISGGDCFTIDRKYKDPWTGPLPVLIVQISNELPTIKDASGALASRYLPLIFTENWQGREDRMLGGRLLAELPGILNRALDGFDFVATTGRFTEPKASQEVAEELAEMASPMRRFVNEMLDVMPRGGNRADFSVDTGALHGAYNRWAITNREEEINLGLFGKRLRALLPGVKRAQPRTATGGRLSSYSGIRLRAQFSTQGALSQLSQRTGMEVRLLQRGGSTTDE